MLAILTDLNHEWAELVQTGDGALAAWARQHPVLRGASGLGELLDVIRARPDEALDALLRLGSGGDPLAWRVVLQAMLGKVVLLCRGRPQLFGDAVAELWLAIAEYPLDRRPRSIAANLSWAVARRLAEPARPVLPEPLPPAPDPTAEETLAVARRLRLIDANTHRTLWLVYVAGLSSAGAAAELGTTPELVRYHCSRTLRRLAGHARRLAA